MRYRHTQRSPVLLSVLAVVESVILVSILFASGDLLAVLVTVAVFGFVGFLGVIFSRLTVEVDATSVRLAFGTGWPSKVIPLGEVQSARNVRNRWWYGFGIRWVPGGRLWNVAGLDAVALTLASGREFRIGTDEPDDLLEALRGVVIIST